MTALARRLMGLLRKKPDDVEPSESSTLDAVYATSAILPEPVIDWSRAEDVVAEWANQLEVQKPVDFVGETECACSTLQEFQVRHSKRLSAPRTEYLAQLNAQGH